MFPFLLLEGLSSQYLLINEAVHYYRFLAFNLTIRTRKSMKIPHPARSVVTKDSKLGLIGFDWLCFLWPEIGFFLLNTLYLLSLR